RGGAHVLDGQRMRALVLANVAEQCIGLVVAGRALVKVANLVVFGCLSRGEQSIDGSELRLEARPHRKTHGGGVRNRCTELGEALLDARPVAGLGGGHAPEYLRTALVTLALRDQLIDRACLDLAAPGLEKPVYRLLWHGFGGAGAGTRSHCSPTAVIVGA